MVVNVLILMWSGEVSSLFKSVQVLKCMVAENFSLECVVFWCHSVLLVFKSVTECKFAVV